MSTSGSTNFTLTRNELISNALQLLGILASGETAQTNDITFCSSVLNAMVKAWMAQGIHLWTEEEGTIYFVENQATYNLPGANGSDGSGTPVETTLSVTAAAAASTITCTTVTGMSSGDVIGIELDDNTIQWTTINGAPNTTTLIVTLTTPLTGQATLSNNVYTYTTALPRPISINSVRCRDSNNFDRYVKILPREDYMRIPQKSLSGQPIIIYYTPQLTTGVLYVWPTPSQVSQRLKITYLRTIQDLDAAGDNFDFPQEWLECLTYNLAVRVAPSYGINLASGGIQGNPDILRQANQYLEDLKAWDAEQPYISIVPNYRYPR